MFHRYFHLAASKLQRIPPPSLFRCGWFRALRRGLGSLSEPKGESLCLDGRGVNRTSASASIRKRSFPKVLVKEAVFRFPEQPGLFTLHAPEQT